MPRNHTAAYGATTSPSTVAELPAVYLETWKRSGGLSRLHIDNAESYAQTTPWWQATGSWRVKIINGTMYLKMLTAQPHWSERTNVLRLLLAVVQQSYQHAPASDISAPWHDRSRIPDVDFVYVHNDNDMTPTRRYPRCPRFNGTGCVASYIPLFTNSHARGRTSIPVPEFSWAGWQAHTPPWCKLFPELLLAGSVPWRNRTDVAFFSGGLSTNGDRKRLRALAQSSDEARALLRVRDVAPHFFVPSRSMNVKAGRAQTLSLTSACGYRYLISLPGYGYSNRLKTLLLCGGVVLHKPYASEEYFMPLLRPDTHLVHIPKTSDILPTLRRLRANESLAQSIAAAGRRVAVSSLRHDQVLAYWQSLLRSYSSIQRERVAAATPDYIRVESLEDLARAAGQCSTCPPPKKQKSPPSLSGGVDVGAKPTESAASRLASWLVRSGGRRLAQKSKGTCSAAASLPPEQRKPRCCTGWDCATSPSLCSETSDVRQIT